MAHQNALESIFIKGGRHEYSPKGLINGPKIEIGGNHEKKSGSRGEIEESGAV